MKWVRSKDGMIAGVCKGLAQSLEIPVGLFRALWIASILFFGVGVGFYLLLAISLPREDRLVESLNARFLGVCALISKKTLVEVGVIRFLTICLALLSMGTTVLGYVILYFVLDNSKNHASDNKPATPPATT